MSAQGNGDPQPTHSPARDQLLSPSAQPHSALRIGQSWLVNKGLGIVLPCLGSREPVAKMRIRGVPSAFQREEGPGGGRRLVECQCWGNRPSCAPLFHWGGTKGQSEPIYPGSRSSLVEDDSSPMLDSVTLTMTLSAPVAGSAQPFHPTHCPCPTPCWLRVGVRSLVCCGVGRRIHDGVS